MCTVYLLQLKGLKNILSKRTVDYNLAGKPHCILLVEFVEVEVLTACFY